jgi:hypothetical protein
VLLRAGSVALLSLCFAGSALADPLDPKEQFTRKDQARAAAVVLTRTDLGPAWTGGARKPTSFKAPRCPAYSPNQHDLVVTGHAESLFRNGTGGIQVDSDAEVFRSEKQARTRFARILQPKLGACLRYDLLKGIPRGSGIIILQAKRLQFAQVAPRTALYRVPLLAKTGKQTATVYSDFLFLNSGRTQVYMNVIANASLETQLKAFELRLAKAVAKRL